MVNKINRKRTFERLRTRWVDVRAQNMENIKENSTFDEASDRKKF